MSGRPKKEPSTEAIHVYLTPVEKQTVQAMALEQALSVNSLVKNAIAEYCQSHPPDSGEEIEVDPDDVRIGTTVYYEPVYVEAMDRLAKLKESSRGRIMRAAIEAYLMQHLPADDDFSRIKRLMDDGK